MQPSLPDELVAFIRDRMAAAARDKVLYDRNGARLNSQLLQGEINMGTAVLTWLERRHAGQPPPDEEGEITEAETGDG